MSRYQRFKEIVKKYWYVAIPVHMATSAGWFGTMFAATKFGLDTVPLLEKTGVPEKYIKPLKQGNLGNLAQALVLYKLVTPLRYGSTLACTRSVVIQLRKRDLIK